MKPSTNESILPVTLQLTALRMERECESRTRRNIGLSCARSRPLPSQRHRRPNPLQLTLLGGGGTTPYSYYPLAVTPAQRALFGRVFLSVLMLQISSQFVKCRRQSLPHEFTEI